MRPDSVARIVAGGVFAVSLYGCGTPERLGTAGIERAIAQSILAQRHVQTQVVCPPKVRNETGFIFKCSARLDVGSYPILVTETNDKGHVRYENATRLVVLDVAKVRRAIMASILTQRRLHSTVNCPHTVLQQAGTVFTCTATVGGRPYPFEVTQTDDAGHVRYVGRR
jgi:hypothetical protein